MNNNIELSELSKKILSQETNTIEVNTPKLLVGDIIVNKFKYVSVSKRVYSAPHTLKKKTHLDIYNLSLIIPDEVSQVAFTDIYHPLDEFENKVSI